MNDLLLGSIVQLDNTVQLPSAGGKKPNLTPVLDQGIANQFVYVCVSYSSVEAVYKEQGKALRWLVNRTGCGESKIRTKADQTGITAWSATADNYELYRVLKVRLI